MTKKLLPIRHGDVNLIPVSEIKGEEFKHKGIYVLAEGEATGSKHILTCDAMVITKEHGNTYFNLGKIGTITHTHDHETIELPIGTYVQVPEREVDHFAESVIRKVID